MDALRIYADFIESRRPLEGGLIQSGEYIERHHIMPKALGGEDSPENLIALTPEDHFFAHLLLAKHYGGKMWAPVAFMVGGARKDYKPIESRKRYAWAKRALSKSVSGKNHYAFDETVRHLRHKDGRAWSGVQSEMGNIGISKSLANMLLKARVSCAMGWFVEGTEPLDLSGSNHPMYKKDTHHFVHIGGDEFVGTQYEFHLARGLPKSSCCLLASGKRVVSRGWHLKGADLNYRKGENSPNYSGVVYVVEHCSGERFSGTTMEVAEKIGGSRGNVSSMLRGVRGTAKGWRLVETVE